MFLFGYSIILLKNKLEYHNKRTIWHLVRRFFLLLVIGLLHSTFIWEGDILFAYGMLGFVTLFFLNRKKRTLFIWAIVLFTLTSILGLGEFEKSAKEITSAEAYVQKETTIYSSGGYWETVDFRLNADLPLGIPDYAYLFILLLAPMMYCPMLLFGMYAAKSGWFTDPSQERKRYIRFAVIFLVTGLILKSIKFVFLDFALGESLYMIGAPLLAIGYIFLFSILYTEKRWSFLLFFEKVGRLSMTNYLLQSIICTSIFYGYGIGLFGKIGVFYGIILAIGIYSLQFIASYYYLRLWKMGPFEKLLRVFTYLTWKGRVKTTLKKKQHTGQKAVGS